MQTEFLPQSAHHHISFHQSYQQPIIHHNVVSSPPVTQSIIPPDQVLRALFEATKNSHCSCNDSGIQPTEEEVERMESVHQEIKYLQNEGKNIRTEIVEVENMLSIRDGLYTQLDQLREDRERIEADIDDRESYIMKQNTLISTQNGGLKYKEMNDRLKRRIFQVREYIQKMTFENQKIEETLINNSYIDRQEPHSKEEVHTHHQKYYQKDYRSGVESILNRLHEKQEEAWKKVRAQEHEIERRNSQMFRSRLSPKNYQRHEIPTRSYYSPEARTYY